MSNFFSFKGSKWIIIRSWFILIFILNTLNYMISTDEPILLIKLLAHAVLAFIVSYLIWYVTRNKVNDDNIG